MHVCFNTGHQDTPLVMAVKLRFCDENWKRSAQRNFTEVYWNKGLNCN